MSTSETGKFAFARIVKECRAKQGLSQIEFGKRVKTSGGTISRWENGKNLPRTREELLRLAEQIGYDPLKLEVAADFARKEEAYLSGIRTASAALTSSVETLIRNAVRVRKNDKKVTVRAQDLESVDKCTEAVQQALRLMESSEPPDTVGEEKGGQDASEDGAKKKAGKKAAKKKTKKKA